MDNNIDNLKQLIEKLKAIGFWERLFGWKSIKNLLVDASGDVQKLVSNNENLVSENLKLNTSISDVSKDLELAKRDATKHESEIGRLAGIVQNQTSSITDLTADLSSRDTSIINLTDRNTDLDTTNQLLNQRFEALQSDRDELKQENTRLLTEEENRKQFHENAVATLDSIREQIQNERAAELEERSELEIERLKNLKEKWTLHQDNVKLAIKSICNKHIVEYVESVTFRGTPDNTLRICDEFVVFDAKSPGGDDLRNFPSYIRDQAEKAKKYAKIEGVKRDVYFVVPTNTLESLTNVVFNLGDYNVHVISFDSLEQIIVSLKKIEEYEFVDALSPEDREVICRVVGRLVHMTKRRIQVDGFFLQHALDLVFKSEQELPEEILQEVIKYERAEKINPPTEKRAKLIDLSELGEKNRRLQNETKVRGLLSEEPFEMDAFAESGKESSENDDDEIP